MATKTSAAAAAKPEPKVKGPKAMEHGAEQSKTSPPKVDAGKQAIWHEPYSYEGKNGTVTVRGHWEVAAAKPKVEKAEAKPKK